MSPGKADYLRYENYKEAMDDYIAIIMETMSAKISQKECMDKGSWIARKNGANIKTDIYYKESVENENLVIEVKNPKTDWKEWIKTLGDVHKEGDSFTIECEEGKMVFVTKESKDGYTVVLPTKYVKHAPVLGKLFRQVFRKSAYCVACKTCEVNCVNKRISFNNGVAISGCIRCRECHTIPVGCLAYHSLRMPQGDGKMKSINTFGTHAPKTEWLAEFFDRRDDFLEENGLGSVQKPFFRRFLKDAGLIAEGKTLPIADKLARIGWDSQTALGIMLANIAYNPQFKWYITNIDVGRFYTRKNMETLLFANEITERNAKAVLSDFKRVVQTPFGLTLNFGYVDSDDNYTRNKCYIGSPIVLLYSLYKFAEACGDYYEFTVSRLLNHNIDSDGISPTQIFGIAEEELMKLLLGLSASNPDYITTKFRYDLDTISLNRHKSASDVLELL
jgi:phosphoadenosine phosphosulfate reductase